jgi:hypothetical protein
LNAYEFHGRGLPVLDAKLNHFANPPHEGVQVLCLGMAAWKGRDRGDVVALFITFD